MRVLSFLELGQRLLLVTMPAWLGWCMLAWFAAPYRPDDFLLAIFVLTVLLAYAGSVWAIAAVVSPRIGLMWRAAFMLVLGLLPLTLIVVIGHFAALATRAFLV